MDARLFLIESLRFFGGSGILFFQILREIYKPPYNLGLVTEQIYQIGIRSFVLVFITALSTGMVMALQFGLGLEKFGGKLYVPKVVSLSIVKEIGPVFASLMLAARVGAGIASEIGSMVVTEQVDAIRALGTSPIRKIVIPRVIACMIAVPLLAGMAIAVGVFGGLLIGWWELGLTPAFYLQKIFETVVLFDYFSGFGKTFFFALFIAIPSCYFGLNVRGGTRGVGLATTRAVVVSSIMILIGDFFLTKMFWALQS